jgi:Holliday junction resolvasome RuvABC DNA-binding subunit
VARADASAQTFQALRHLGFREGEVRRALREAAQAVSLCEAAQNGASAGVEALVRECLLRLTERRARPK